MLLFKTPGWFLQTEGWLALPTWQVACSVNSNVFASGDHNASSTNTNPERKSVHRLFFRSHSERQPEWAGVTTVLQKMQQVLCNRSLLRWCSHQSSFHSSLQQVVFGFLSPGVERQTDRPVTDTPEPPPSAWLKTNEKKFHSVTLKGQRLQWIYYHNVNPVNYTKKN